MTLDPSWSRPRSYPVEGGVIRTHSLEVHVTDHCNLRCAGCCVLSPLAARRFLEPGVLRRDLAWAREILRPSVFKLSGGEPLMSPHIVDLVRIAKDSEIAPRVSLTTNGLLLARAPDVLFEDLDAITLSVYPVAGIDEHALAAVRARAERFGVALNEKRQDELQAMTRRAPERDVAVVQATYDSCWLRHRCHTLRDGILYACSRPPGIGVLPLAGDFVASRDGLSLEPRESLAAEVQAYLERREPLVSCAHCLGGTGAFFPYRQLTRDDVVARSPE